MRLFLITITFCFFYNISVYGQDVKEKDSLFFDVSDSFFTKSKLDSTRFDIPVFVHQHPLFLRETDTQVKIPSCSKKVTFQEFIDTDGFTLKNKGESKVAVDNEVITQLNKFVIFICHENYCKRAFLYSEYH
jgi:hypothetical protein